MIEKIAQILCELVRNESISANSNLDIIDYIERLLASSGVSARRIPSSDGRKACRCVHDLAGLFCRRRLQQFVSSGTAEPYLD